MNAARSPKTEGGTSSRKVLGGLLVLTLIAIGVFGYLYYELVYYRKAAAYHVPEDAAFAARLDLQQAILFAPVREHILPVFLNAEGDGAAQRAAFAEVEAATGVNLGMDVREVVLVTMPDENGMGFVIGGSFPKTSVVEGLAALLSERHAGLCSLVGQRLTCPLLRLSLEQASDGVVVAASKAALLEKMLERTDAYERIGLRAEGPGSFGWPSPLANWDVPLVPLGSLLPDGSSLARVRGHLELGADVTVTVVADPKPGADLSAWLPRLSSLRDVLQNVLRLTPGRDYAGERALLSRIHFAANEKGGLVGKVEWTRAEVEQAARSLAALLDGWLSAAPR